jgi:hypothetical protein
MYGHNCRRAAHAFIPLLNPHKVMAIRMSCQGARAWQNLVCRQSMRSGGAPRAPKILPQPYPVSTGALFGLFNELRKARLHFLHDIGVFGIGSKILHLVAIVLEIVKLINVLDKRIGDVFPLSGANRHILRS